MSLSVQSIQNESFLNSYIEAVGQTRSVFRNTALEQSYIEGVSQFLSRSGSRQETRRSSRSKRDTAGHSCSSCTASEEEFIGESSASDVLFNEGESDSGGRPPGSYPPGSGGPPTTIPDLDSFSTLMCNRIYGRVEQGSADWQRCVATCDPRGEGDTCVSICTYVYAQNPNNPTEWGCQLYAACIPCEEDLIPDEPRDPDPPSGPEGPGASALQL